MLNIRNTSREGFDREHNKTFDIFDRGPFYFGTSDAALDNVCDISLRLLPIQRTILRESIPTYQIILYIKFIHILPYIHSYRNS